MFVLIESVMNGTITMSVGATILDYSTFEEAVSEVKSMISKIDDIDVDIRKDTDELFCYEISQEFPVVGLLGNKHADIHKSTQ